MWIRNFEKEYFGVNKQVIWKLWTDINNWPTWHGDLDYCQFEGKFEKNNYFLLKPKGIKPVKITLVDVQEGQSFTDCTTFFGAKMFDTHSMVDTPQGLKLTNTLKVVGPLSWLWVFLVARNVASSIPREVDALVNKARSQS